MKNRTKFFKIFFRYSENLNTKIKKGSEKNFRSFFIFLIKHDLIHITFSRKNSEFLNKSGIEQMQKIVSLSLNLKKLYCIKIQINN